MKKKLIMLLLVASLMVVSASVGAYAATKKLTLIVNGTVANVDPFKKDGVTYVPVRAAAEMLGVEVGWDGETETVTLTSKGNIEVDTYHVGDFVLTQMIVKVNALDMWDVSVEVANNGSKALSAGIITASFYDESGKRIGSATGAVNDLGIKETKLVSFISTDDLSDYKSVKFQTDTVLYE